MLLAVYCVLRELTAVPVDRDRSEFTPPKSKQHTVNSTFSLNYKVQT
jgi:hypothetical protein